MADKNSHKILIWGIDNFNMLGLLRQLSVENHEVLFMVHGGTGGCATKSRYCKDFVIINSLEEGREYLLKNCPTTGEKSIIICSGDEVAEYLDEIQAELSPYYIVPGAKEPGMITKVTDKCYMTRLAAEVGFNIPKSIEFGADTNLDNCFFPCLLKPSHQIKGKYNEFKTRLCKTRKSLAFTQKFIRKEGRFIAQEYIPFENVSLVYGCVLKNGEVRLAGVLEKDRFADNGDGSHGTIRADLPIYIKREVIEAFLIRIGYYGLFSIEFGVCNDTAYFFEINLRNDGTSHYFFQAGANIPLAWVKDAMGEDISFVSTRVKELSYFIDELADEQNVKKGKVSKEQWKKEKAEATIFKYYDGQDIEPYLAMKKRFKKNMILDRLLSKYRIYVVWIFDRIGFIRK